MTTASQIDKRGFFVIDGRYQTSVQGVWALGDINGHGAFTHTAYQDSQILLEPPRSVDGRVQIYAMFTDPPLGRVGMNVRDARARPQVLKAEVPMSRVSRAVLEGETTGLLRILVDADTEEFLGATIIGLHADDLVQIIGTAMQAGVRYPASGMRCRSIRRWRSTSPQCCTRWSRWSEAAAHPASDSRPSRLPSGSVSTATRRPGPTSRTPDLTVAPWARSFSTISSMSSTCQ